MKKQILYIFYSEKDEIYLKLVKTYTNRFCIDEDEQSEVIGFQAVSEISETNLALSVFQYLGSLQTHKSKGFQELRTVAKVIVDITNRNIAPNNKLDEYQIHFIFGIPDSFFTKNIVKMTSGVYDVYKNRKRPQLLRSTLLDGQIEKLNPHFDPNQLRKNKTNVATIGDDIDLFIDESYSFSNKFSERQKSFSVFRNSDDSSWIIKCDRKTYGNKNCKDFGFEFYIRDFFIHLALIFFLVSIRDLIFDWFNEGISEIFNFDSRAWLGFVHGFLLGFSLILQTSVITVLFYIFWKFLRICYAYISMLVIASSRKEWTNGTILFTYKRMNGMILFRYVLFSAFLSLIILFIRMIYHDTTSLIANLIYLVNLILL